MGSLLELLTCPHEVAARFGHVRRAEQTSCARGRRCDVADRERALVPTRCLVDLAAAPPKAPDRACEHQRALAIPHVTCKRERLTHVVLLERETLEPLSLIRPGQLRFGLLDKLEIEREMPIAQVHAFADRRQELRGELTDRLQHPIARPELRLALTKQTLVEKRLERVRVGAGDLLRGVVARATREDGEASEELLLALAQKVVRPLDRPSQGLLARIGVALALEQVEPLREPLEQLLGAKERGAGSGELERERELVETEAELSDGLA